MYQCKTQSDLSKFVKGQPAPYLFFDVFLELEKKNLLTYLAFDSKAVKELLGEANHEHFGSDFPLIYKQNNGLSAIDTALDKNQLRSVNYMISYILKYQNSFVYGNLFTHNLVEMLDKEVRLSELLNSNIFNYVFDFDAWPGTNTDVSKHLKPYNDSVFSLREIYPIIFRKIWLKDQERETKELEGV